MDPVSQLCDFCREADANLFFWEEQYCFACYKAAGGKPGDKDMMGNEFDAKDEAV